MPSHRFVQCDVFTDRAFGGNPLAVFPDGRGIDDATLQKIAREMNLSETVFVLPPSDPAKALRRLRIFTPATELPMAGHPVVGTWHVLAREGIVLAPASGAGSVTVQQELGVGILPVAIEFAGGAPVRVVMTQPQPRFEPRPDLAGAAARALGLAPDEIAGGPLPLCVASAGVPFLVVPVRGRAALARIAVREAGLVACLDHAKASGLYAVSLETHARDAAASARMLGPPAIGVAEDPATGSAAGPLAAALVQHGVVRPVDGVARFAIEQGIDMGRPSRIECEVEGGPGAVRTVRIAGGSVVVAEGELRW
jgi:trans-2,3-dihydro-3-hydroxyanthranilate isomerase